MTAAKVDLEPVEGDIRYSKMRKKAGRRKLEIFLKLKSIVYSLLL